VRKIAGIFFLVLILLLISGCAKQPKSLGTNEITEYNGQKLTLAGNIRENSIKGPPGINIETYRLRIDGLVNSPQNYSYGDVLQKTPYTKLIVLHCVEGWNATIL
jgi:DMSO/TMAO reductase YedYZ molybdopterin-dependent catalytic subunit